jgi:adenylate cyclase
MARRRSGLALGFLVGLAGVILSLTPFGSDLEEHFGLLWLFKLRGATPAPPDVVIVAIDQQSAEKLGLPRKPSEWPRLMHARLIESLARAQARVIALDLILDMPSGSPEYDQQFSAAIRQARTVVLVESVQRQTTHPDTEPGATFSIERLIPPLPILADSALAHAPFPLPKTSRVNAYWTFKTSAGDSPTFPVAAFQVYAFQVYDEFVGLWRKVGAAESIALPANRQAASDDVQGLMLTLRNTLTNDPKIAGRMLEELRKTSDEDLHPSKKRVIKSMLGLYVGGETPYLNFYGPARTIKTIPYHQVLQQSQSTAEEAVDASTLDDFKGKAVFVGFSAASQIEQDRIRDDYRTVFSQASGLDIAGVEIAATAFANLLEERPVRTVAFASQLAFVMFWGFAVGLGCRWFRPVGAAAFTVLITGAWLLVAYHQFTTSSFWLPLVIPLCFQAPVALFGAVALHYRAARRERELVKEAFGYFLPDAAIDRLLEHVGPITSANQEVFGVCLSTDVEHYTTLAEKMEPRKLSVLMNEYFAALFGPIERHGGIVSDIVGDAMMAIWVAPAPDSALRSRACRAALEIAETMRRFNQSDERPALPTRIGLHAGQVLLGSIGAAHHYEYRAVGDIVNTASRIEGLGKHLGARLLASDAVVEGLEEILARPMGDFLLAGKSTPVRVCELLGLKANADERQRWLCSEFGVALNAYARQQWADASGKFSHILDAFPEDGPSRFYHQRCEQYAAAPPADGWDPAVRIERK